MMTNKDWEDYYDPLRRCFGKKEMYSNKPENEHCSKILSYEEFLAMFVEAYNADESDQMNDPKIIANMLYYATFVLVSTLIPTPFGPNPSFIGKFDRTVPEKYWKIKSCYPFNHTNTLQVSGFIGPSSLAYLKTDNSIVAFDMTGAILRLVPFV